MEYFCENVGGDDSYDFGYDAVTLLSSGDYVLITAESERLTDAWGNACTVYVVVNSKTSVREFEGCVFMDVYNYYLDASELFKRLKDIGGGI